MHATDAPKKRSSKPWFSRFSEVDKKALPVAAATALAAATFLPFFRNSASYDELIDCFAQTKKTLSSNASTKNFVGEVHLFEPVYRVKGAPYFGSASGIVIIPKQGCAEALAKSTPHLVEVLNKEFARSNKEIKFNFPRTIEWPYKGSTRPAIFSGAKGSSRTDFWGKTKELWDEKRMLSRFEKGKILVPKPTPPEKPFPLKTVPLWSNIPTARKPNNTIRKIPQRRTKRR